MPIPIIPIIIALTPIALKVIDKISENLHKEDENLIK